MRVASAPARKPGPAELVTGVKRDIKLLGRVEASTGDYVTVLDISLDSNRKGLMRLLEAGASIEYFDDHYAGEIPTHQNLVAHIDLSAEICTSVLVDRHLRGHYWLWAIVAAFGDNLGQGARILAQDAGLTEPEIRKLASLGEYLNYNGYGERLQDLHLDPAILYEKMRPYADPFDFIANSSAFDRLAAGFHNDIRKAARIPPLRAGATMLRICYPMRRGRGGQPVFSRTSSQMIIR